MATEEPQAPEGFTKAESSTNRDDYDTEWVERPTQSEQLRGSLLAVKRDRGQYDSTLIELRLTESYGDLDAGELVCCWITDGIESALEENDVTRGEEIIITCDGTFQIDGESRRKYVVYTEE